MQSLSRKLCTSNCLMLRPELQRCQPCACGKASVVHLRAAALVAQSAMATLAIPQRLGLAKQNGLVMQLWRLSGFGQELLEHFLEQLGGRRLQPHAHGLVELNQKLSKLM